MNYITIYLIKITNFWNHLQLEALNEKSLLIKKKQIDLNSITPYLINQARIHIWHKNRLVK